MASKTQPEATLAPEQLTTASSIEAWKEEMCTRAWVDNAANAIGLSLYNFLNDSTTLINSGFTAQLRFW